MPIPDRNTLGPGFERRLKAALDRVTPPSLLLSSARYRSATPARPRLAWRLAPALVGIGVAGMALTAVAATGSPNPAVWTERAGAVIQSVSHIPSSSPKAARTPRPEPSHGSSSGQGTVPGRPSPSSGHEQEPKQTPEPTEKPEASPRPEPTDRPEPSPTPDSSGRDEPTPSPEPEGH